MMQKVEQRKDTWMWAVVETGIQLQDVEGYAAAYLYLINQGVDLLTAERVLKDPEARRVLCNAL